MPTVTTDLVRFRQMTRSPDEPGYDQCIDTTLEVLKTYIELDPIRRTALLMEAERLRDEQ